MRRFQTLTSRVAPVALILAATALLTGCEQIFCLGNGGNWVEREYCYPISYVDGQISEACRVQEYCSRLSAHGATAAAGEALMIPASAHVSGALGTDWRSDVELHNLGDGPATVSIWLLRHGAENSSPVASRVTVGPGRSVRLADLLADPFSLDGQAALMLWVGSGRIVATSRTYNLLAAGNPLGLPGGSTFGQYIPALPERESIGFGEEGRLIQLSHSTAASGGFRTNLGLVNTTSVALQVEVELYAADGTLLGTVPVTLPPFGYQQLNRVFASVTSGDVADGYAVVRTTTEGGRFFAYASVVDNLTGDPIAITAQKVPRDEPPGAGEPTYVVAAAHLSGIGGTNWRTDLEIHNWGEGTAVFTVELLEHGVDNLSPSRVATFTVVAGRSRRFGDILESEFGFSGAAALRITPSSGQVLVTSRTYNLLGEGNDAGLPAGATFGQYIPGVTMADAIQEGEEGRLIQLAHTPGGASGFRTNLVLVNATAKQIGVEVNLYSSDGTPLGTDSRTLLAYEYRQLNGVFELVTGSQVADGYAVVRTTTAGGALFALASVVDNLTGDPVGQDAAVVQSAGSEGVLGEIEGVFDVLGGTTIERTIDGIQMVGVGGLVDVFVSAWSDVASRTASGMVVDYGEGTPRADGSVWTGTTTVDTSGLSVTSNRVSGTVTIVQDGVTVDGEPAAIGSTSWTVDLEERADGTVAGTITVEPAGANTADGALGGTIVVDTAICERYPISGSLSLVHGGELITIAPSPECNGSLDRDVVAMPPGVDFYYAFADPASPVAALFVHSTSNAVVAPYDTVRRAWMPAVGGEAFATTTPGVVVLHFAFDRQVVGGRLTFPLWARNWGENGRGHAFLDGSTDGVTWQQLSALEPIEGESLVAGGWWEALPPMFVGSTDIWLRARLYSVGPRTSYGPPYTRLATMCDWDPRWTQWFFEIAVDLQGP